MGEGVTHALFALTQHACVDNPILGLCTILVEFSFCLANEAGGAICYLLIVYDCSVSRTA